MLIEFPSLLSQLTTVAEIIEELEVRFGAEQRLVFMLPMDIDKQCPE